MSECSCKKSPWWSRQIIACLKIFLHAGTILAVLTSWEKFHSVGYSTYVAFAGWLYVAIPNFFDNAWMVSK